MTMLQTNKPWQMVHPQVNIILFGEMDAGKSSLINLISGLDCNIAKVSLGASGHTLDTKHHDATTQGQDFHIFKAIC